jgi:hypothetical protein
MLKKSVSKLENYCLCYTDRTLISEQGNYRCLFWGKGTSCYYPRHEAILLTYSLHGAESLLRKLTGFQLVKKFSAFYGTWRFIPVFTSARHLFLSWASSFQPVPPHPTWWRSILILSFHLRLGLPNGLSPSGFPTKTLYKPLLSPIRATCPSHLILLDFITRTLLVEDESVWGSRSITPLILNLDSRWWWVVNIIPKLLYPRERSHVPTE